MGQIFDRASFNEGYEEGREEVRDFVLDRLDRAVGQVDPALREALILIKLEVVREFGDRS